MRILLGVFGILFAMSPIEAAAQMELFGTQVSFGTNIPSYDASTTSIDLTIQVDIDPMSTPGGFGFPSGMSLPFNDDSLTVNGQSVDTASDCTYVNANRIVCQYAYGLTAAERSASSITFSGDYVFAHFYQPMPGAPLETYFSNGQQLRSVDLTLTRSTIASATCNTENAPLMPSGMNGGSFVFTISQADVCPNTFWIDPPIAVAYEYTVSGASFVQITVPNAQSVADPDGYIVSFPGAGLPAINLMPGQSHVLANPLTKFTIGGIDPQLQLDPTDSAAFPTGIELTVPTGPVTITQTPKSPPPLGPPPPPAPLLLGTQVTVTQLDILNPEIVTVTNAGPELAAYITRFAIDIGRENIQISFAPTPGGASYGNGMRLNFKNLQPTVQGCNGPGMVTGAVATTTNGSAVYTVSGTSISGYDVVVPLAPVSGVYNWSESDTINVALTFACRIGAGPPPIRMERKVSPASPRERARPAPPRTKRSAPPLAPKPPERQPN